MDLSNERIVRKPELWERVALSDTTIWRLEKKGLFPKRLRIGGNAVGWLASEIEKWLEAKAEERV
jgi:prophage regulatory protein